MNNYEVNQAVVGSLAGLVSGTSLLKIYEYSPRTCNGGMWLDTEISNKVAEELGLDDPVTYTARSHEDIVIHAALVRIDMLTGEAHLVTDGTQIIQFDVIHEQVIFGLNGGYANRVFTLLRGDGISLHPMSYGAGFTVCNAPDVQTFLIISDKMEPQLIAM